MIGFRVQPEDAGKRLDVCLAEKGCYASRSEAARAIDDGLVLVNGDQSVKKHPLAEGEFIVYEPLGTSSPVELTGEPIPLDIRYEDNDIIVLSKQTGLICHPSADHDHGTLSNALIHRYGRERLCNVQGDFDRPGIVHRLDGDTSGLMLAAKTDEAGAILMEMIANRLIDRRYLALVHGRIAPDSGLIDAPIARSAQDRTRMAVRDVDSAREATTSFEVLERFSAGKNDEGYTLIACKLFTGRTHQIRVHLQYIRHPVVGDATYTAYAPKNIRASLGLDRQFLHSYRLHLNHPLTGEALDFIDALPNDLLRAYEAISEQSEGRTAAGDEIFSLLAGAKRNELIA